MKIGIAIAMAEEFQSLNTIMANSKTNILGNTKIESVQYCGHDIFATISGIGKAAAASATTLLLLQYNCDLIINIGSCGGVNTAEVGSFVISNQAGYGDVDVSAFGYKLGQLPNQPELFISKNNVLNFNELLNKIKTIHKTSYGTIVTSDSFINDINIVNKVKSIYSDTVAVEMEAAAIAQVCNSYNRDFLFIKKVSDMADTKASVSFKEEIKKMEESTSSLIEYILKNI